MTLAVEKPIICPVLVGRDQEVAQGRHLLNQTRSGQGQVLLLCGEAGIGKSRLVTELRASAASQGFDVMEGKSFPTDRSCPLYHRSRTRGAGILEGNGEVEHTQRGESVLSLEL